MPKCDCGTEITAKNAAGHFRDQCIACIRETAQQANKHVHVCEKSECFVCRSWRGERREQAQTRMTIADWRKTAARKGRLDEQVTLSDEP